MCMCVCLSLHPLRWAHSLWRIQGPQLRFLFSNLNSILLESADPTQHEFLHHKVESNWNELYIISVDLRSWWRQKVRHEIIQILTKFSNTIKLSWKGKSWIDLNWIELIWIELNWTDLTSIELKWIFYIWT